MAAAADVTSTATPARWVADAFPAGRRPPADPLRPETWTTPFDCDGQDRHAVTLPTRRLLPIALFGLLSVIASAALKLAPQSIGSGIGLMLIPILVGASRQDVSGATLIYRRWWRRHALRLDTANSAVLAANGKHKHRNGRVGLYVGGPDVPKPIRVAIAPGRPGAEQLRAHLAGWLLREGVSVGPGVEEWLRSTDIFIPKPVPKWATRLRLISNGVGFAALAAALVLQVFVFHHYKVATSAADCTETAPAGASATARQYLADLNASYGSWTAVTKTLIHNDSLTPAVLEQQEAADQTFVTSVRAITFPASLSALANDYLGKIQGYDLMLGSAAQSPGAFDSLRRFIHPLNDARIADSTQLRKQLGLPPARCRIVRPL